MHVFSFTSLTVFLFCFSDKDAQSSDTSQHTSINVILFGTLAKDFSQNVSHGVSLSFKVLEVPLKESGGNVDAFPAGLIHKLDLVKFNTISKERALQEY